MSKKIDELEFEVNFANQEVLKLWENKQRFNTERSLSCLRSIDTGARIMLAGILISCLALIGLAMCCAYRLHPSSLGLITVVAAAVCSCVVLVITGFGGLLKIEEYGFYVNDNIKAFLAYHGTLEIELGCSGYDISKLSLAHITALAEESVREAAREYVRIAENNLSQQEYVIASQLAFTRKICFLAENGIIPIEKKRLSALDWLNDDAAMTKVTH